MATDWGQIFNTALEGYAGIEAAKISKDGAAYYDARPEYIADQRGSYYPSGPAYAMPAAGVPQWVLIAGGLLVAGVLAVVVLK
jgi:hypothetical protein